MPVYLFEIVDEDSEIYGFGVIAPDDSTAMRLERRLGKAVLLGEMVSPDATSLDVFRKMLN